MASCSLALRVLRKRSQSARANRKRLSRSGAGLPPQLSVVKIGQWSDPAPRSGLASQPLSHSDRSKRSFAKTRSMADTPDSEGLVTVSLESPYDQPRSSTQSARPLACAEGLPCHHGTAQSSW